MSAAVARGTHRLWDEPPWIVDDPFALVLVGADWEQFAADSRAIVRTPVFRQGHAGVQVRTRYPEDRLAEGNQGQYVVLGAGLDAFAWRRPDLLRRLKVFEVDHPATQAWKRERAAVLGLPTSENHVFVPVNFETHDLAERLNCAGFDWAEPAFFSWVGTTMYLNPAAVAAVLNLVARCAKASEVALSYNLTPEFMDDFGREFFAAIAPKLADQSEPVLRPWSRAAGSPSPIIRLRTNSRCVTAPGVPTVSVRSLSSG